MALSEHDDVVWCQKEIEEKGRGLAVFVRVEEGLYEGELQAYKAIRGASEGDGSRGAAAAVSVPGGVGRLLGRALSDGPDRVPEDGEPLADGAAGKEAVAVYGRRTAEAGGAGQEARWKALAEVATIATPDTILRWYRELVAKKYDGSARRGLGRPRTVAEIARLLVEMARLNTGWGYTRLRGALKNVGHAVGRNTIKRILKEQGIEPAPLRRRQYSWATFIKAHFSAISAADFFTVEVQSWVGLVRYHVFFVMNLASRRVEIAGISRCPDGPWMGAGGARPARRI